MSNKVILICTECLNRNYYNYKNKLTHKARLELKKFCPYCKKHTLHKESR